MYTYKIKVIKTSGFLKESAGNMPKVLIYKSANKLNERAVFNKAASYIRDKYGAILEMADVTNGGEQEDIEKINELIEYVYDNDPGESAELFADACVDMAQRTLNVKISGPRLEKLVRQCAEEFWYQENAKMV